MFAVIYRAYIKPGCEPEYETAWKRVASYFYQERGALGSTLHRSPEGLYIAYSRWPDKKSRDASWPGEEAPSLELPPDVQKAITIIQESIDQSKKVPEICMEIVDSVGYTQIDSKRGF